MWWRRSESRTITIQSITLRHFSLSFSLYVCLSVSLTSPHLDLVYQMCVSQIGKRKILESKMLLIICKSQAFKSAALLSTYTDSWVCVESTLTSHLPSILCTSATITTHASIYRYIRLYSNIYMYKHPCIHIIYKHISHMDTSTYKCVHVGKYKACKCKFSYMGICMWIHIYVHTLTHLAVQSVHM